MDLNFVNSLVDKYNNLVFAYKLGHIFHIEQHVPHGLNTIIVENVGKLMLIKINRLRAYADQISKSEEEDVIEPPIVEEEEDVIEPLPPLEDGEHPIKVFHRYVGSEELTDLGVHNITVRNNLAQINDNSLFPEGAVYKQYPWKYRILSNKLKERYIIILSDNSGIWAYDTEYLSVQINNELEDTVTEIPSYTLPLLSINGTIITSLANFITNRKLTIDFTEDWNVSNVTNTYNMFNNTNIQNELDLSNWDVSNVTNMNWMFEHATIPSLNLSGWNLSSVTTQTNGIFRNANITNLNLNGWNLSNVTSLAAMFLGSNIPNLDISSWDVSNVTDIDYLFNDANIGDLNLSGWNLSSVTSMQIVFSNFKSINLNVSDWNVSNITSFYAMFNFSDISNLDLSGWDISNAAHMDAMFSNTTISSIKLSKTGARLLTVFPGNIGEWKVNGNALTDTNWKDEWGDGPVTFTK